MAAGGIVGQALQTSALGLEEYQQQKSQRTMELQTTSHSDAQQVGEVVSNHWILINQKLVVDPAPLACKVRIGQG